MNGKRHVDRRGSRIREEFPFVPRIINPVKIRAVVLFSADEVIRESHRVLEAEMPWVSVHVLSSPLMVSRFCSSEAAVVILDDVAMNLVDAGLIRRNNSDVVIVLLSSIRLIQCSPPGIAQKEFPYTSKADLVFAVNRGDFAPDRIIASVVRSAEDHLNIEKRSEVRRFVLLIVDDEPNWPSQFLPILYKIIGQRADVKITRTYEEALRFMFGVERESDIREEYRDLGHGDQVICLITDVLFPRDGRMDSDAGGDLIRIVNRLYARIPIVIATQTRDVTPLSDKGFILAKGDPGSLETLNNYIRDRTGIGDFVIHDEDGKEEYRAKDIHGMYELLSKAEGRSREAGRLRALLEAYGEKDKFSTWFYMHGFQSLGDALRPQRLKGEKMIALLKKSVKDAMMRMRSTPLVVDGTKVFSLPELLNVLGSASTAQIEELSHNDIISSWLDQQGFSELAEALRPVHGEGPELRGIIAGKIADWLDTNTERINNTRRREIRPRGGRS